MELSKLTFAELKSLSETICEEIGTREQDEIRKARDQILAIVQSVGLPLSDLLSVKSGKGGKPVKSVDVKFRHPSDTSKSWTGRGRKPAWIFELEQSGQIDSARVKK